MWITLIGIVFFIMALVVLAWNICEVGVIQERREKEYYMYYDRIGLVLDNEVCEANYEWICRLFDHLLQCKYKNPEMTKVLNDRFVLQYAEIIEKRRVSEND